MILIFLDITSHQKRVELHIKKSLLYLHILYLFSGHFWFYKKREQNRGRERKRKKERAKDAQEVRVIRKSSTTLPD
jgi:hypothetical protein